MAQRGPSLILTDFSGGYNTQDPEYLLPLNQSPDCQNLILLPKGFTKRRGDTAFNSSAMVSGSTVVAGGGYIKFDSGTEFLNAVAGTKFFTSSSLSGTMADATGAVTITSGQNNIWTPVIYNNLQIWFGGAPDAPFKYSGSGNAAALGGTPPSASTAFVANNRIFAISTAANPSIVQWPIVSNPEDWTGTGSGNASVSLSDGEALQCGTVTGTDTAILFKNSSTHLMVLTRAPFPIYQLQKGVGISGRWAFVNVDGVIYFVTPGRRMKATKDGINFQDFPDSIDSIWDSINTDRIAYIQGYYHRPLEHIYWLVSTGSSTQNNYCIVWDLKRKCWGPPFPTGYDVNVPIFVQNRRFFAGQYDGKIYEKDKSNTYTDASETSPGAINGYWRTPFKGANDLASTIHPTWIDVSCKNETSSTLTISYGFDNATPIQTTSVTLSAGGALWDDAEWDVDSWAGQSSVIKRVFVYGRGNVFSMTFGNSTASQSFTFEGCTLPLRTDRARKIFTVV